MEIFDSNSNRYIPSVPGLGMHVDVKDPEEKIMLSRVGVLNLFFCAFLFGYSLKVIFSFGRNLSANLICIDKLSFNSVK